jgi:hypothetical protein
MTLSIDGRMRICAASTGKSNSCCAGHCRKPAGFPIWRRVVRIRSERRLEQKLPKELQQSAPRPVGLNSSGKATAAGAIALLIAAVFSAVLLYALATGDDERVRRLAAEGISTEAQVTRVDRKRGENPQVIVTYSYTVNGRVYSGRTKLRKRDRGQVNVGSQVAVRYLPSRPNESWMHGYGPSRMTFWLVPVIPMVLVLGAITIGIVLRRQAQLLAEGRSALARVTATKKVSGGEGEVWRVDYEWMLLSGARRTGHCDRAKNPPAPGTVIPMVYDRDNPHAHALYPLSLVRVNAS